ncbi:MAG: ATP-grasp domain-containing protein [Epsilonproteobacteria bacterium]|nr:ATP-grasp domain-containing protein [Campylobacterota bacterium]
MKQKILLLGGSHRDIPLIKAAKELGFFVITLGDRAYYIGHQYADQYYQINFNDTKKVQEIIKREKIAYLIPGCGEESYLQTVALSHEIGRGNFDTLQAAKLIHNKWALKNFCLEHNISTPKGFLYTDVEDIKTLKFPIVVKPTNLSGGRGVEVVHNEKELQRSLQEAQKISSEIFLEEYIEGKLIAYSVFIKDQKIAYGFSGEDRSYLNPYLVTTAYPVNIAPKIIKKLQNDIEKLCNILQLVDGMFHLQVLIQNDIPYIIDVTRRIPGDLYPWLIEKCDGIAYSKAVIKAYIGEQISDELQRHNSSNFVIRHCVMPSENGFYKEIQIDPSLQDKILYRLDLLKQSTAVTDYLHTQIAIFFIELEHQDMQLVNNLNTLITPLVTQETH